jgi:N-acetylmuramoyl-L-alanine amidase
MGVTADRKFRIALDIGHTPHAPGAIGADGRKEYDFNKQIVDLLVQELSRESNLHVIVINKDGHEISLERRSMIANAANADAFLAIHHDSANDRYLEPVKVDGKVYHQTKRFHGYSVFFSKKNPKFEDSQRFGLALARAMHSAGFTPTLHHAEPIQGENRELVDRDLGVYRFDDLVVLKRSNMPAALLECGVIVNPDEERELEGTNRQMKTVKALKTAILEFAQSAEPSRSTPVASPAQ